MLSQVLADALVRCSERSTDDSSRPSANAPLGVLALASTGAVEGPRSAIERRSGPIGSVMTRVSSGWLARFWRRPLTTSSATGD